MSRALASAQNRRAGQTQVQQQFNPRVVPPQPSINSAQIFSQQTQQKASSQQTSQSQVQDKKQMTIKQAITLITLRLGVIETKLMNMDNEKVLNQYTSEDGSDMVLIDKTVLNSITSRLEAMEKRPGSTSSTSEKDMMLLKNQMEQIKPSVVQTKQAAITIVKENKILKERMEEMMSEMIELKRIVEEIMIKKEDVEYQEENVDINENGAEKREGAGEIEENVEGAGEIEENVDGGLDLAVLNVDLSNIE